MNYERFIANVQLASMDPFFEESNMTKIIANQFVGFSKLTIVGRCLYYCRIFFLFEQIHECN